jgi:hypothetical protein
MSKWYDANGTDVDAYPERAFQGGVYNGGVLGKDRHMTIVFTNPHGLSFNVETVCSNRNMVKVSLRTYPNKIVDVPMHMDDFNSHWREWVDNNSNVSVDVAFADLPITIRDFFQMGVHPSEWAEMFSGTDIAEQHRDTDAYREYVKNFPYNDPRD